MRPRSTDRNPYDDPAYADSYQEAVDFGRANEWLRELLMDIRDHHEIFSRIDRASPPIAKRIIECTKGRKRGGRT